ncbi:MAG: hypothetical protein GY759_03660, partial [Chloroflexi bacterium]|nr:hypothetical protein [Chloroflexota bacterium]
MKPLVTKNAPLIALALMTVLIAFPLQNVTRASKLFDSPIPTATPIPSATPVSTPTPVETEPPIEVYVLTDAMFEEELSAVEREARLQQGLPVPATLKLDNDAQLSPVITPSLHAQSPSSVNDWDDYFYDTSFEENIFVDGGACYWENYVEGQQIWWERDTFRSRSGSYAMWPAAGPSPDPNHTYPNDLTAQLICVLSDMAGYENVLADFWMWLDLADTEADTSEGDEIGVYFSSDGTNYRGISWPGPRSQNWTQYRVYYPRLDNANDNTVYIMWQFTSDEAGTAEGVWLDDLKIRRYDRPSKSCKWDDPSMSVPGVPGGQAVSKGLMLPLYNDDDPYGRIQRLTDAGVHWTRLEFIASANNYGETQTEPIGDAHWLHIDLQKYDAVIDDLCENGIAVLGLLSGRMLARQDWVGGIPPQSYIDEFSDVSAFLAEYYADRIRYWEVWNEPDHSTSRLLPDSYADLLNATSGAILGKEPWDKIVFGGLGSADLTARNLYLDQLLKQNSISYNVFALHPYPSVDYTYADGSLKLDPQDLYHAESPTIIHKFLDTLNTYGDWGTPIWATEMGWNAAKYGNIAPTCNAISNQLVTSGQQSAYLTRGFDILFTETGWNAYTPSITKLFWYQYRDTGACVQCNPVSAASTTSNSAWSPSGNANLVGAAC